jgi:hypothetical protein
MAGRRSAPPEGLGACNPEAVRIALGIAHERGLYPAVRHLRAVDHGAAVLVVNDPDQRAPGDRSRNRRK